MAKLKGSPKTGGRQKGTKNKASSNVTEQLAALGCDPIAGMVTIAKESMLVKDYTTAGNMYKELAQYTAAKRKSVEVNAHISFEQRLLEMTDDELDDELRGYGLDAGGL